jgi:hypothetical protein
MTYRKNLGIIADNDVRNAAMSLLAQRMRTIPPGWKPHLAEASLTLTSADKSRIVKIDSYKVYTLDVRQPDGTYKSSRFPCKSVDEAWAMASQILRVHRPTNAIH